MGILQTIKWRVSTRNRRRKLQYITQKIPDGASIIDVGVYPIQPSSNPGTNYIEEHFLSTNRPITALGLEEEDFRLFQERYTNAELVLFDGMHYPDFENRFDIALSNAVIEHVGEHPMQLEWLQGLSKICKKLIITTPNKFFPIEMHRDVLFLHWFPVETRQKLLRFFRMPEDKFAGIHLLSKRDFVNVLEAAGFRILSVKRNWFFCFPMDFVVIAESVS